MPISEPLLVVTHAAAGRSDDPELEAALSVLRERCSVEVQATDGPGELDGVLHRAGSRPIIVAGGDGSIHAVIAALHRRHELEDRVLGILPAGTGNDLARMLEIPLDLEQAAQAILDGEPKPMDLLVDEVGNVVVNNVHLGAGAEAARHGAVWKERLGSVGVGPVNLGRLGYPLGALMAAVDPPTLRVRVTVDDEVVTDVDSPVLQVALGNGASVGGGTELVPDANPFDGLIDVLVASPAGRLSQLSYVVRLPFGAHRTHGDVTTVRGRTVSVSGSKFWCSADGELYGPERHRTWRVEAGAYSMILPPDGESGATA